MRASTPNHRPCRGVWLRLTPRVGSRAEHGPIERVRTTPRVVTARHGEATSVAPRWTGRRRLTEPAELRAPRRRPGAPSHRRSHPPDPTSLNVPSGDTQGLRAAREGRRRRCSPCPARHPGVHADGYATEGAIVSRHGRPRVICVVCKQNKQSKPRTRKARDSHDY